MSKASLFRLVIRAGRNALLVCVIVSLALTAVAAMGAPSPIASAGRWVTSLATDVGRSVVPDPTRIAKSTPVLRSAAASITQGATVTTDKADYLPGQTVTITGAGFGSSENVTVRVSHVSGTTEPAFQHEPWTVTTGTDGTFETYWLVTQDAYGATLLVTAHGETSGLHAEVTFTDGPSVDIDQCQNGPVGTVGPGDCVGTDGDEWINGNLGASKSHFQEGDSVPYRARFDGLNVNATYTLTMRYDTTKGGKHALDYLTSFDRTVPQPGNNPCVLKQGGSVVSICDTSSFTTVPIPVDARVTAGFDQLIGTLGDNIAQIPGVLTLYNGTDLTITSAYPLSGSYAGDSTTSITIRFKATATNAVLAWGGHIGTRSDWGLTNSAIAINGSPYHMDFGNFTCSDVSNCSTGAQDRSLSADAVFFPVALTIVKETNPDEAQVKTFNFTTTGNNLSDFSLTPPDGTTADQKAFSLTDQTTRTVTESDPGASAPQFSLTAISCTQTDGGLGVGTFSTNVGTRTVSLTPKEGQLITCTFVNDENLNLTRGTIVVKKKTEPAAASDKFTFTPDYLPGTFELSDGQTNTTGGLTPGQYSVSENALAGWDLTKTECVSSLGDTESAAALELDAGETITCTFTNTKSPKLTVTKTVVGDTTTTFDLLIDGVVKADSVKNGGTTGAQAVSVGEHTVSETFGDGSPISSDWTSVIGGDCGTDGKITLAAGDEKSCTITNTKQPKLTVIKVVVGDTTTTFDLLIDGVVKANDVKNNGTTGAQTVTIGDHTVTETFGNGDPISSDWTAVISGDCDTTTGKVTVAAGDNKTCTITNTKKPKLTVNKVVVGDTTTTFDLLIDGSVAGTGNDVKNGGTTGAQTVTIGEHTASETFGNGDPISSDWTVVINGACDPATGKVTLAAGDNKTCTITNTKRPKLTVNKVVVGDTTTTFDLLIDGVIKAENVKDGGTTGAQIVSIAEHTVSETFGDGSPISSDWTAVIGGDCAADGKVTLAAGDNKTCTITNTRQPKLTVTKVVVGDTTTTFDLKIDGVVKANDVKDGGSTGAQTVTIGEHTVSETFGNGNAISSDWTVVISGDCDATTGKVTLAAGESKTCVITNTKRPKLTVTKVVVGDTTTTFDLLIDGSVAGTGNDVKSGGTTGAQYVTIGDHTVGETFGDGSSISIDWAVVINGACGVDGKVTLAAGDNKTCTITNTKRPKLIVNKVVVGDTTTTFDLLIDGSVAGTGNDVKNGGTTGVQYVGIGAHTVSETFGNGAAISDEWTAVINGDCAANGYVTLAAGQSKSCTITNTKKGHVTLTKLTGGVEDPNYIWKFTLKGTGVDASAETPPTSGIFGTFLLVPGDTYTLCEGPIPAGWTIEVKVDTNGDGTPDTIIPFDPTTNNASIPAGGSYSNIYDPKYAPPPTPYTNDTRCAKFKVQAGQTLAFSINNKFPGGDPRTIGFWKNWNTCTGGNQVATATKNGGPAKGWFILDDLLNNPGYLIGDLALDAVQANNNPLTSTDCQIAVLILDKSDVKSGKKMANDGAYNLAAQLLAAQLNFTAGAKNCAAALNAVNAAQALLADNPVNFVGIGPYLKSGPLFNQANVLAATLDKYNNGQLCQ